MQTEEITLRVPADIARAFHNAPPEAREQVSTKVGEVLRYALMTRGEAVREFERIADQMSKTARERGLTDERLQELLDDPDHDE